MEYVNLGRSGLKVSRICLGSMTFGNWGIGEKETSEIVHRAIDDGINFIDTADIYSAGNSEEVVGKAVKDVRKDVIIATKFGCGTDSGPNGGGAGRHRIIKQAERSLNFLGTDYIDLYMIHWPDLETPIDETLRALDDLVRQGKVRYIGCSNFDAWRILESLWVSDKMNLERFVVNQPCYNILNRSIEKEILPVSRKYGLTNLCYSPLAQGWLTGKYSDKKNIPDGSRGLEAKWDLNNPENLINYEKTQKLTLIAKRKEISLGQLALAWLLAQGNEIIPIIGVKTMAQYIDNVGAINVKLSQAEVNEINEI
jgi:aryl-alcohol dehydrogenase-like predicted oxidoreductase